MFTFSTTFEILNFVQSQTFCGYKHLPSDSDAPSPYPTNLDFNTCKGYSNYLAHRSQ